MKIFLSGGGTLGSVSPLVAIYLELKRCLPQSEFLWAGTKNGPEKKMVEEYGISFYALPSGKYRRYFSLQNIFDSILILANFFVSFFLLIRYRADIIISAGGFVSVPLVLAGWILGIPSLIHQQDVEAGLANKLMSPFAKKITVTFESSISSFPRKKSIVTGNPCRQDLELGHKEKSISFFGFSNTVPVILFLGGGRGAAWLNSFVEKNLDNLLQFSQIIHSSGIGKMKNFPKHLRYRGYEYLDKNLMKMSYSAADLVVSRAGMSTLTELAYLQKPALLIALPQSHQVKNAREFEKKEAAKVFDQSALDEKNFVKNIQELLYNHTQLQKLSHNISRIFPRDANERVVKEIMKIVYMKKN